MQSVLQTPCTVYKHLRTQQAKAQSKTVILAVFNTVTVSYRQALKRSYPRPRARGRTQSQQLHSVTLWCRLIVEPLEKLNAGSSSSSSNTGATSEQLSVALVITKSGLLQALLQQLMQLRGDTSHMQPSTHSGAGDPTPAASCQASDALDSSSGVLKEGQVSGIGGIWKCQCCQRGLSLRPEVTSGRPGPFNGSRL